ncbi:glycosyltransferase family 4 protein, partial [Chromobacterium sphagni]|uniref:glycosyltransferase family 4 protein n=1 Tax=Chromobacterium sphagni TaxID=1903179 RepID=UPI000B1B6D9B
HPKRFLKNLIKNPSSIFGRGTSQDAKQCPVDSIFPLPVLTRWLPYLNGFKRVSLGESDATAPLMYGPVVLARLIKKLKPDLIHSLEFQHCGYNVLKAKEIHGPGFPKWLATNWGSDIYYYRQFEAHRSQISRLLRNLDYYSCECVRDVEMAKELGLQAEVMPVMPNTGGLNLDLVNSLRSIHPVAQRKILMVKGYQHFAGRALTALDALERCVVELKGYQVVVFSASPEIFGRVEELRDFVGIDIKVLPHASHDVVLRMFSRARAYLGVSVSDAISTSMLEAMAMGAFPIQTNTSCCSEWITCGKSGFEIPVDDPEAIAIRLKRVLADDELVESAAAINWVTVQERLDQKVLKEKAAGFYRTIFSKEV